MSLIVVSGAIANKLHQGGEAWVRLSYVLGLRRLGYDVHFLEQIDPAECIGREGAPAAFEDSAHHNYFWEVMRQFDLEHSSTLLPVREGIASDTAHELWHLADSADALLNVSGHLRIEPLLSRFRRRVFVDIDPGYTQFWHTDKVAGGELAAHHFYFTIAENIHSSQCTIPTAGIEWKVTRPPVVLEQWPFATEPSNPHRYTTIANWRGSYGTVVFGGRTFGLKAHEFRKMRELPALRRTDHFEIALSIHPADATDRSALESGGWKLTDPRLTTSTPDQFRRYVAGSGAEFSVAQGIYVETLSGWFSDRTTRYLASGRPTLVQDTGFSRILPTGAGLIPFRNLEEAVRGAQTIGEDYEMHRQAARRIAETHFDSDRVLSRLMEEIGVPPDSI